MTTPLAPATRLIAALLGLIVPLTHAQDRQNQKVTKWKEDVTASWFEDNRWDQGVPKQGWQAVIAHGTVTVENKGVVGEIELSGTTAAHLKLTDKVADLHAPLVTVGLGDQRFGAVTVTAGQLTTGVINVGHKGTGTFVQEGGKVTSLWVTVGWQDRAKGTYRMKGGSLIVERLQLAHGSHPFGSDDVEAEFVQEGGDVNVSKQWAYVGGSGKKATYTLSGGTLALAAGLAIESREQGSASFEQSGGKLTVKEQLKVGWGVGNPRDSFTVSGETTDCTLAGGVRISKSGTVTLKKKAKVKTNLVEVDDGKLDDADGKFEPIPPATKTEVKNVEKGKVRPGRDDHGDAGVITIIGDYQQGPESSIAFDLFGTNEEQYDVLECTGLATLGGALLVTAAPSYLPQAGDTFRIVRCGVRSGTFDESQVVLPPLPSYLQWNSSTDRYRADGVTLEVLPNDGFGHRDDGSIESGWVVQNPTGSNDYFNVDFGAAPAWVSELDELAIAVLDFGTSQDYPAAGIANANYGIDATGNTPDIGAPLALITPFTFPGGIFATTSAAYVAQAISVPATWLGAHVHGWVKLPPGDPGLLSVGADTNGMIGAYSGFTLDGYTTPSLVATLLNWGIRVTAR